MRQMVPSLGPVMFEVGDLVQKRVPDGYVGVVEWCDGRNLTCRIIIPGPATTDGEEFKQLGESGGHEVGWYTYYTPPKETHDTTS